MKKVLVDILGLSYSHTQEGAYAIVLNDAVGNRKLPIIVSDIYAQTIALKMEGVKTQRPLTHDLFKTFVEVFDGDLTQVYIFNLVEGIFYAKLIVEHNLGTSEIDCAIGDALAIAMTFEAPIYVAEHVISSVGIVMDDNGVVTKEQISTPKPKVETIDDLKEELARALADEDYEAAAKVRDRIAKLNEKIEK